MLELPGWGIQYSTWLCCALSAVAQSLYQQKLATGREEGKDKEMEVLKDRVRKSLSRAQNEEFENIAVLFTIYKREI